MQGKPKEETSPKILIQRQAAQRLMCLKSDLGANKPKAMLLLKAYCTGILREHKHKNMHYKWTCKTEKNPVKWNCFMCFISFWSAAASSTNSIHPLSKGILGNCDSCYSTKSSRRVAELSFVCTFLGVTQFVFVHTSGVAFTSLSLTDTFVFLCVQENITSVTIFVKARYTHTHAHTHTQRMVACVAVSESSLVCTLWSAVELNKRCTVTLLLFTLVEQEQKNLKTIQILFFLIVSDYVYKKHAKNSSFIYIGTYLHCNCFPDGCAMLLF